MKINQLFYGFLSLGMIFGFTQCTEKTANVSDSSTNAVPVASSELKIAYVNIDSLLAHYEFYQDMSENMLRKEENSRLVLSEEANKLQKEIDDFQRKLQNNVFSSQERAQQEQNRLLKKQQELNDMTDRIRTELSTESDNNSMIISDSIQSFLKDYNKKKGFSIILSKVGDNILYVDESMNITDEVISGLNERYRAK
jgi:outer membrane protein